MNYSVKQEYNHIYIDKKQELRNMKECDYSKIHKSSIFVLSVCLLIRLDALLLRPSLYCNTSLHFTILHPITLHYAYRQFTSSHLQLTTFNYISYRSISPHITKLGTVYSFYYYILPSTQLQQNIMLMKHVSTYNSHLQAKLSYRVVARNHPVKH